MFSLRYKVNFLFLAVLLISLLGCVFLVNYRVTQAQEEEVHQILHQQMQQVFHSLQQGEWQLQQHADYLAQYFRIDTFSVEPSVVVKPLSVIIGDHARLGLDGVAWYDANDTLRLSSITVAELQSVLAQNLQGVHGNKGLLWQKNKVWRWIKQTLAVGQGSIVVWQMLDFNYFKNIYDNSIVQDKYSSFMLLQQAQIFFNYGYIQEKIDLYPAWQQGLQSIAAQLDQAEDYQILGKTRQIQLLDQRFVYIIGPKQGLSPAFIIAYAIDQRLGFLKNLHHDFILFTCLLIALGLLFAAPLSRWSFSNLQHLLVATDQIRHEHYQFRLPINGHDEFAQLSLSINNMLQKLEQQQNKQQIMRQLISRELLDNMLHGQLTQQAHFRRTTILYCDVIQFERIYNKLDPNVSLDFINNYFTRMQFAIDAYNGSVDGYAGTATRVLFGLVDTHDNSVVQAIYTALAICNAVDLFNLEVALPLDKRLQIGIGIHRDRLLLGRLGAENRRFYSALGTGLHISHWLQQLSQEYEAEILITKQAWLQAQKDPAMKTLSLRYIATRQPPFAHPPIAIYQIIVGHAEDMTIPPQDEPLEN